MPLPRDNLDSVSIEALRAADNWQDKYRLLMQWSSLITPKPELHCDHYRVQGCESAAWLTCDKQGEHCEFFFDGESRIIKGLMAVLLKETLGCDARRLADFDFAALLSTLGLHKHLSPSRNNGLLAVSQRMRLISQFANGGQ